MKQGALKDARIRFEKDLMSRKFEDMEITKHMRDQADEKDRFDEAKHQHEREEQNNLKTILKY